ncbi:MAG: hypothetical protein HC852_05900 [Acaryochloridaceae cyanobacterium RU_4_10]|nr:hypothetical protein [Acaryochloridaceae cyanobacterium RU_4_10]
MSLQNLNSELLVELSDEQEECANGGGQLTDLSEYFNTDFEAAQTVNLTRIASGPGGSFVEEKFATANVDTNAYKSIDASFD